MYRPYLRLTLRRQSSSDLNFALQRLCGPHLRSRGSEGKHYKGNQYQRQHYSQFFLHQPSVWIEADFTTSEKEVLQTIQALKLKNRLDY